MSEVRQNIECDYCGATFHIKYADHLTAPEYCAFCSEAFTNPEFDNEEDDGDLDYCDNERNEIDRYS